MLREVVKMSIWVEWFKQEDSRKNTWAQMRESAKWNPPKPSKINRRYFDKHIDAAEFAKRKNDEGYHASVKSDGAAWYG